MLTALIIAAIVWGVSLVAVVWMALTAPTGPDWWW